MLCEEDAPLLGLLVQGLRLLEDDALGGGGSRGSGRVRFSDLKMTWRSKDYYSTGKPEEQLASAPALDALQTAINEKGSAFLTA
jgi:CRISPR-associated protein Csm3